MGQQHEDGWFPWLPGGGTTFNTQGPTARGLLKSYQVTGIQAYLDAAVKTGDYMISTDYYGDGTTGEYTWDNNEPKFASHDPLFLEELSMVTGDSTYSDYVDTWLWQKLETGGYGDAPETTKALANRMVLGRSGDLVNLPGYDIGPLAIAAHLAGKGDIINDLMEDGILYWLENRFELETDYDVVGLAGAVYASAVTGYNLNPTEGDLSAYNSTAELAALLAGWTQEDNDGAWLYNSDHEIYDGTGSLQSTAFALKALASLNDPIYDDQIIAGIEFICSLQIEEGDNTGAFSSSDTNGDVNVMVNGDALAGIGVALGYYLHSRNFIPMISNNPYK